MKICFKCKKEKNFIDFYKHSEMKDGHLNKCKECTKKDSKNNEKNSSKSNLSYDKTEKGVIRVIYKAQKLNSKRRNHIPPSYTKNELSDWMYQNNYKKLYNCWKLSNYNKKLKPSCDRLDDFKPYSLENIKLGTWESNKQKQTIDMYMGRGTSGKRCKSVYQLDSNMNLICEFVSISAATRAMGYTIQKSIKNNKKDKKGFYWKLK